MKKYVMIGVAAVLVGMIITGFAYREPIMVLYRSIKAFQEENLAHSFQTMYEIQPTATIPKGERIFLFHPSFIHPENGYRYYSYYQSAILETILLLRELDVPIEEIQVFMKNRSAASMEQVLKEKIEDLDRSMAHLRAVRKTLSYHRQNMQTLLAMDLSEITIVQKKERSLVTVDINQDTTFDKQVEMITAETKKYQLRRLHDASYGTMIAVDSLQKGNFEDYSKFLLKFRSP